MLQRDRGTMGYCRKILPLLAFALFLAPAGDAKADDPDFLTFSAGWFDFNRQKDEGGEFRLEYRSDKKFWIFKPFGMVSGASNGMTFVGAGVLIDVFLGRQFVVTPSFAPT